jgi:hypothetical protein
MEKWRNSKWHDSVRVNRGTLFMPYYNLYTF